MSETSVNEKLFAEAKSAAGRLCFDISVDKKTCYQMTYKLKVEIEKMLASLVKPVKDSPND